jgi:hypothetical protein
MVLLQRYGLSPKCKRIQCVLEVNYIKLPGGEMSLEATRLSLTCLDLVDILFFP